MKATARAHSNIAFIKYWGKKDEELRIPLNSSISVNLHNQYTTTTVEFNTKFTKDMFILNGTEENAQRVSKHLDRIRNRAFLQSKAKVVSQNTFATASGLASSASGFAALTLAAATAAGLSLTEKELSILARLGSGSACRSIPDGFVEWKKGNSNSSSYAVSLFPPHYWDIAVLAVVVDAKQKEVSSTVGQKKALDNPFLPIRLKNIQKKIRQLKQYLKEKNFHLFGELVEKEAIEMHAIALTSSPPILYWNAQTVNLIHHIWNLRKQGLMTYFTIDAGPHVYVLVEKENTKSLVKELLKIKGIKKIIHNTPSRGTYLLDEHLF